MLRDIPPFRSASEDHQPLSPYLSMVDNDGEDMDTLPHEDPLDDVFGSAPASPSLATSENLALGSGSDANEFGSQHLRLAHERSDIPRLRSTHVTNGYRDGIAESKAGSVQDGFDEGYSLGAVLGLKAGRCLGVLEGVWRAAISSDLTTTTTCVGTLPDAGQSAENNTVTIESIKQLKDQASGELKVQSLFGSAYFGPDGIWIYDVPGQERDVTFREVADAHPVLNKWSTIAKDLAGSIGLPRLE